MAHQVLFAMFRLDEDGKPVTDEPDMIVADPSWWMLRAEGQPPKYKAIPFRV